MSSSLEERLSTKRHQRFVGRQRELKLFWSAITATELPFQVLHIFGPGGIGKTSLLREFIQICREAGMPTIYLDARNIEPAPEAFLSVLRSLMNLTPSESPFQVLTSQLGRCILLIDTYEMVEPLDEWLREEFLPHLPANILTVLAGRHPPSSAWQTDPGWQALLHPLSLRNLSPKHSRTYLTKREIPVVQHQAVLDFTHGHPLALSLIADVFSQGQDINLHPPTTGDAPAGVMAVPDVVKILLDRFVQEVPSVAHRMTLEACALVCVTTEALLATMLAMSDVHELFEWLRGLSFIESGRLGLFPHDLAREVLTADLRWRNPDWYTELHGRARTYYMTGLQQTHGRKQHHILFDYIFLHRDNPAVRPRFTWQENSNLSTDMLRETDKPALVQMVTEHEGEASARLAAHWLARQPQGVLVFRDTQQQPVGFILMVALHQASIEDLSADPGAIASWRYLQHHAPLRLGEEATLFRFWMAQDTYQAVSPIQSLIFINFVQHHRSTAGLAFTFFSCAEPDYWAAMFAYADLARLTEADFEVGGRRYGVYGHDWRVVSTAVWQELLAQREIAASVQTITPSQVSEPLLVLSQPEFVEAVKDALRHFSHPSALHNNPLLQSRLLVEHVAAKAGRHERVAALQALVKEVVESLQPSPREAKLYRALDRTYLHPAPTQELAAELLNLPFGTFRRHLKAGIARIVDLLWQQEIS